VVVAGHLTVDEIRLPDGRTLPGTNGGAAAYAALGGFLAQGEVLVVARVGEDYPMEPLRMSHPDGGAIGTGGIVVVPGRSIHNIAHYGADGSRNFEIEDFGVLVEQTPRPEDLLELEVGDRWVLVAPMTLAQQAELVAAFKARGARVALDTELHYLGDRDALEQLRKLTRSIDCFLPSREHLQQLCGVAADAGPEELRAAVEGFAAPLTIVKCGREGAVVFSPDHPGGNLVPAVPDLEVADPTGAGDGFNGGCLVSMARGRPPLEAALEGCVAASFVVQAVGAQIPATFSAAERDSRKAHCAPRPSRDHREVRIV
jgi:sugar/nucleoside kinase (ribokinase family)